MAAKRSEFSMKRKLEQSKKQEIKKKKKGLFTLYHLFAKEGGSILYNGWYSICGENGILSLPECVVSSYTIYKRMNEYHENEFISLWEIITTKYISVNKYTKTKYRKTKVGAKIVPYSEKELEFLNMMRLFKVPSLINTTK